MVDLTFEVVCSECNTELEIIEAGGTNGYADICITVKPCEQCIEDAIKEAIEEVNNDSQANLRKINETVK